MRLPPTAATAIDVKAVEALIAERIQAGDLVGVSLAAARDGKIVLAGGYGRARIDDVRAVTVDTLFAVGSVTKQFTAACILLLAEDGKLAVTDKVAKYYPDLTRAADISILDLLNHVSGYPDYYPLDFVDRRMAKPMAVDDVIRAYGKGALDFEPGSRYSYSNTGFLILGRIVERVSGEAFGSFLSRRILAPLGMKHTIYEPEAKGSAFAEGHTTFALSAPMIASHEGRGWIAMAGALYSTASDLVRWDLGLHGGKVLKPESYKLMTTRRRLSDGTLSNYACGLGIGERNGVPVISHNGAVSGFYALNLAVPSTGSAVAVLINFEAGGQANKILRLIVPALFPPALRRQPAPAAPSRAQAGRPGKIRDSGHRRAGGRRRGQADVPGPASGVHRPGRAGRRVQLVSFGRKDQGRVRPAQILRCSHGRHGDHDRRARRDGSVDGGIEIRLELPPNPDVSDSRRQGPTILRQQKLKH